MHLTGSDVSLFYATRWGAVAAAMAKLLRALQSLTCKDHCDLKPRLVEGPMEAVGWTATIKEEVVVVLKAVQADPGIDGAHVDDVGGLDAVLQQYRRIYRVLLLDLGSAVYLDGY